MAILRRRRNPLAWEGNTSRLVRFGEVTRDSALSTIAAAVDITTADGKIHQLSQPAARGSDVNPMSDTDLEDKLRTTAHGWNPHYDTAPLIDAIWALDTSADVSSLARLAVPR